MGQQINGTHCIRSNKKVVYCIHFFPFLCISSPLFQTTRSLSPFLATNPPLFSLTARPLFNLDGVFFFQWKQTIALFVRVSCYVRVRANAQLLLETSRGARLVRCCLRRSRTTRSAIVVRATVCERTVTASVRAVARRVGSAAGWQMVSG